MLRLDNIKKVFNPNTVNENKVINGISLTVNSDDFITIIGSNGAGKSTLFNLIAGSYPVSSGKIFFEDKDITKAKEYKRARVLGRIFQNPLLGTSGKMSIEDNMILYRKKGFKYLKVSLNEKVRREFRDELSKLGMGLEDRLRDNVELLSGGQRQALTLLMTVLSKPKLILLDEHTAALDPDNSNKVMELTLQLRKEYNLTMIMITHNMGHAIKYGNRLLMMDSGEVIFTAEESEKLKLTKDILMQKFMNIRKTDLDDDRILLA